MRILLVEDEKPIAEALTQVLQKNNYIVDTVFDGEKGLDYGLSNIYDAIVLDIMLPKCDGLNVLENLRASGIETPVILLTARWRIEDRVRGLDAGADDYLAKPFHAEELMARLRSLCRRQAALINNGILTFEEISLNPHSLIASAKGESVSLTPKESNILELLIKQKGMVLTKDVIIDRVWGFEADAEYSHVETQISLLRKKLTALPVDIAIRAIRGVGYVLQKPER